MIFYCKYKHFFDVRTQTNLVSTCKRKLIILTSMCTKLYKSLQELNIEFKTSLETVEKICAS